MGDSNGPSSTSGRNFGRCTCCSRTGHRRLGGHGRTGGCTASGQGHAALGYSDGPGHSDVPLHLGVRGEAGPDHAADQGQRHRLRAHRCNPGRAVLVGSDRDLVAVPGSADRCSGCRRQEDHHVRADDAVLRPSGRHRSHHGTAHACRAPALRAAAQTAGGPLQVQGPLLGDLERAESRRLLVPAFGGGLRQPAARGARGGEVGGSFCRGALRRNRRGLAAWGHQGAGLSARSLRPSHADLALRPGGDPRLYSRQPDQGFVLGAGESGGVRHSGPVPQAHGLSWRCDQAAGHHRGRRPRERGHQGDRGFSGRALPAGCSGMVQAAPPGSDHLVLALQRAVR